MLLFASSTVEAAGGGGLQLFVDAGIPVDSQLVRQFVDEALAEIIAIMLGQRQSESKTLVQEPPQQRTPSPVRSSHIPQNILRLNTFISIMCMRILSDIGSES